MLTEKAIIRFQPYRAVGNHASNSGAAVVSQIVPTQANGILIQATTQSIWLRLDGGTPAVGVGFFIRAGDPAVLIPLNGGAVVTWIQDAATAVVNWQYVIVE